MVRVPKWPGRLTRGDLEVEGFMYPQASTGSSLWWFFSSGFSEFEQGSFLLFLLIFEVKLRNSCTFFIIWAGEIIFPRFLRSFELILDTVLLFLGEKTIEHCPFEFWAYLGVLCLYFWGNRGFPSLFWVKLCEKGHFLGKFLLLLEWVLEFVWTAV